MLDAMQLNSSTLRPDYRLNNNFNMSKPVFGSAEEKAEEPADSVEVSEPEDTVKAGPDKGGETKAEEQQFSIKNAAHQFSHGFIDPLRQLVELMKEPKGLAAAAVGGIGIGFVANKVKSFPKYALVATSAIGVYNIGKGVVELVSAESVEEKEESFNTMGKGSFYTVSSLLPATNIARSHNLLKTENTNPVKSLIAVWQGTIDDASRIFKNFDKPDEIRKILGMATAGNATVEAADAVTPDTDLDVEVDLTDIPTAKPGTPLDVVEELVPEDSTARALVETSKNLMTNPGVTAQMGTMQSPGSAANDSNHNLAA